LFINYAIKVVLRRYGMTLYYICSQYYCISQNKQLEYFYCVHIHPLYFLYEVYFYFILYFPVPPIVFHRFSDGCSCTTRESCGRKNRRMNDRLSTDVRVISNLSIETRIVNNSNSMLDMANPTLRPTIKKRHHQSMKFHIYLEYTG
jgi:hypothetical protein